MKKIFTAILALAALLSCGKTEEPNSLRMVHSQMSRCGDATYLDYTDGRLLQHTAAACKIFVSYDLFLRP